MKNSESFNSWIRAIQGTFGKEKEELIEERILELKHGIMFQI